MGLFDHILLGIQFAFSGTAFFGVPVTILMVGSGFVFGVLVGATPGLAGPMAMAIALPILISLFGYEAAALLPVMGFLLGVMKGATLGGAVPAILFNTPGTPDALMTTFDGYPMTINGKGREALKTAHFASVSGDSFSDIVLFICAPFLAIYVEAYLDLPEKTALILLSLTFIAAIMGQSVIKSLIAVAMGLFVAFIGTGEGFYPRLSLGINDLNGGFPIAIVVLGVLVIGEVLMTIHKAREEQTKTGQIEQVNLSKSGWLSWAKRKAMMPYIATSAVIGTGIGALPGIGSTMAATLGYTVGKRRHQARKTPDEAAFGQGAPQGIAATEAANSAVSGANLIPVLSLGIPGNAAAVFLILAMESIDGINPGPGVFKVPSEGTNPEMIMVFGLFTLMALANLLNWVVGIHIMQAMSNMAKIPKQLLMPTVLLVTLTAIYAEHASMLALVWLVGFGLFGFILRLLGFPILPFVIAFILARPLENTARQAFASTGADPWFLFSSPVAIALMAGCFFVISFSALRRLKHDAS